MKDIDKLTIADEIFNIGFESKILLAEFEENHIYVDAVMPEQYFNSRGCVR